jgi:UDP-N-acetylglucosamine diphosphorylase / glucose-1-phosphate thymidylyltransferase / UDP-N-acetylgalactosamine diphosphorylase / glucosamine-1-phosphate N-acetyltransferase / galactosamine-1-phosphate N-acetyltransferase
MIAMNFQDLSVIILAAGKGTRLKPYSRKTPKVLMKIDNKTLIERNIEIVRDHIKKDRVHVVLGHYAGKIRDYLEQRGNIGVAITYHEIPSDDIRRGLLNSLLKLRPHMKGHFMVLLGDEVYFSPDHHDFVEEMQKKRDFDIYCMVRKANSPTEILKNYSLEVDGDRITGIVEKPTKVTNDYVGLGTIVCSVNLLDRAREEIGDLQSMHFIDLLDWGISRNMKAYYYVSQCRYFNINSKEDLFQARFSYRSENIDRCSKALIIPAYNEAQSIGYVVREFRDLVDDIIVMDNVSRDGTSGIAREAGARVFSRPLKGYGDAIRQGLQEADADILVITEADMTFRSDDLSKLLEYLKDADAVVGTRTNRSFIHAQANMDWLLRLGNLLFGKVISLLWWDRACRLSDVGCTYRAMWRSTYEQIKDRLKANGPELSPEIMVEILNDYLRLVEVPVKYSQRAVGESKISVSKWHSMVVAQRMLFLILSRRVIKWLENSRAVLSLMLKGRET